MTPTEKQADFLTDDHLELLYGGAAGGGKSDALLMGASQYLHVPGYAAILFRRTNPLLSRPGGLMSRAEKWWRNTEARWVEDEKTWYFPCRGGGTSSVTFGYMEHEKNKYDYLAYEFQFIGFDELTEFSEGQYRFLFGRLRRTEMLKEANVPLRMFSASNPGNTGHEWVRSRFISLDPWDEGRLPAYYEEDAGVWVPQSRFIPATLDDNPYIDREGYIRSLAMMDPVLRQQYLKGNWDASAGGAQMSRADFEIIQELPRDLVVGVRHWDIAATAPLPGQETHPDADWSAGALVLLDASGRLIIHDIDRFQGRPHEVETRVLQDAMADLEMGYQLGVPIMTTMEQEPGASGKIVIDHYRSRVLTGYPFMEVRSSGKKEFRSIPLANQAAAHNVKCYRGPWIRAFLDEVDTFPYGDHDDQVDAVAGATNGIVGGGFIREAIPAVRELFAWR